MEGVYETRIEKNSSTDWNIVLLNKAELTKYLPVTIIVVIILSVGIFGNILVIYIYKNKFKLTSARIYILSLAAADLIVCVFGIPYHVLDLTLILTYTNKNLCKVFSYFIGACTFSSIFILLVVGLDRYLKVCRPLKRQIVDFGDGKACTAAVLLAMVISIPNGIIYGHSSVSTGINNLTGIECFIDDKYQGSNLVFGYMIFNMLVFLLSVIFLITMYLCICHQIYRNDTREINLSKKRTIVCCRSCYSDTTHEHGDEVEYFDTEEINLKRLKISRRDEQIRQHNFNKKSSISKDITERRETLIRHSGQRKKVEDKNTRKITLMMMTITLVFILSYLPFMVISLMDNLYGTFWDGLTGFKAIMLDLLLRIYLVNNAVNPIIYSFWDFRFRRETVGLIKKLFCCFNENKDKDRCKSHHLSNSCSSRLTC